MTECEESPSVERHYRKIVKDAPRYQEGRTACKADHGDTIWGPMPLATRDKEKVTCAACKRTQAFHDEVPF